ncbi:MAG TPA: hypothetical protein VGR47_01575 [Terracidiphilus sp.]|nr:hypothetical protein [Terracidiphilus sp.]
MARALPASQRASKQEAKGVLLRALAAEAQRKEAAVQMAQGDWLRALPVEARRWRAEMRLAAQEHC